ncbi:hypothetical protein QYF61_019743 [Mycteria americana]|uniref:Uncharacterized protein n=1 Tax=Mycteria americana TaxID=33587 RepID=A0AAN7N678_MYCAM|nr:hypothetical protein QYF61_019743 [Mycteria americana]
MIINRIGWKRPLRSSSPTVNLTLPRPPLHYVPKHLIQTSFKYLQGWRLNHFPGQPLPMLDNPFSEEKFPNIQSKPPLAQLEAISSCPITCYLGEEINPHLSTTSFQTLHQLRCPSLDTLQHLSVSLVVRGPKLNTVFEGHDHFPSPAGHAIVDTSQDAIGFLGHLGTLLAHIQVAVNQHPQVLSCQAAFQPLFPKPVALHGVAVAQVQDLALGLVKPHTIDLGPSIQPVQVPLQSLPTLKQILLLKTEAKKALTCGPSHRRQSSTNFSNVGPSHSLQFFKNCSSVVPFHRVQSFRNKTAPAWLPSGVTVPARSLLQRRLSMGSQLPLGHIHLLQHGVLYGLHLL